MLGLDKKAVEKLKTLKAREDLSGIHAGIVSSMLEKYSEPSWHFFTSAQRKLIDEMHEIYCEPPDRKDLALLEFMDGALEDPNIGSSEKERIAAIFQRAGRIPKRFSQYDMEFVKRLKKDLESRARQQEVRDKLEAALAGGEVRPGAEEFCESIITQFDERRRWSPVQMEHAEKILAGNRDPGE